MTDEKVCKCERCPAVDTVDVLMARLDAAQKDLTNAREDVGRVMRNWNDDSLRVRVRLAIGEAVLEAIASRIRPDIDDAAAEIAKKALEMLEAMGEYGRD